MRSLKISLVCSLALFAELFHSVAGTQSVSNSVKYLTPGCRKVGKTKEHVGLCAGDSIEMVIDGGAVFSATGTDVTIGGNLVVTGTSTHKGLETFNAGIATNTVVPATGTTLAIGNAATTVTIPGNLAVTGTSTHEGLETFNGDLATDLIFSTDFPTRSVNIPGNGQDSLQIGKNGK